MALKTKINTTIQKTKNISAVTEATQHLQVLIGAALAAIALDLFLIPNEFLDGGITGVSILLKNHIPFGVALAVLNAIVITAVYFTFGLSKRTVFRTVTGVAALAGFSTFLHHIHAQPLTDEAWLAFLCGGALLGLGIGLAIHAGGALDASEILAVAVAERTKYNVEMIILGINVLVFSAAIFVRGWEAGIASVAMFYVVVAGVISRITSGQAEYKLVKISTENPLTVALAIEEEYPKVAIKCRESELFNTKTKEFDRGVFELTLKVTRLELPVVLEKVAANDPDAEVSASQVDVFGSKYEKSHSSH